MEKLLTVCLLLFLSLPVYASDDNPTVQRINKIIDDSQEAYDRQYERNMELWQFLEEDSDRNRALQIQEERNDILRNWGASEDQSGNSSRDRTSVDKGGNLILPSYLE